MKSVERGSLMQSYNLTHLNLSCNRQLTFRTLSNISHDLKVSDIKVLDFFSNSLWVLSY